MLASRLTCISCRSPGPSTPSLAASWREHMSVPARLRHRHNLTSNAPPPTQLLNRPTYVPAPQTGVYPLPHTRPVQLWRRRFGTASSACTKSSYVLPSLPSQQPMYPVTLHGMAISTDGLLLALPWPRLSSRVRILPPALPRRLHGARRARQPE